MAKKSEKDKDEDSEDKKSEEGGSSDSKSKGKEVIAEIGAWQILSAVLVVLLIASLFTGGFRGVTGVNSEPKEEVVRDITTFLEDNVLSGDSSVEVISVREESGIYIANLSMTMQGQTANQQLYVSQDGKYLFSAPIEVSEWKQSMESMQGAQSNQTASGAEQDTQKLDAPDREEPTVSLYIMSFCPYGNKAENTMEPVYNLLKEEINFEPHYIVSKSGDGFESLHGQEEVEQNKRELCVLNEHGMDAWWDFVTYVNDNCGSDGSCWKEAAESTGISVENITTCVDQKGNELLEQEATKTSEQGVTGSPTMFINGENANSVYEYNNPDAYKTSICTGFTTEPSECSEELSSQGTQNSGTQATC